MGLDKNFSMAAILFSLGTMFIPLLLVVPLSRALRIAQSKVLDYVASCYILKIMKYTTDKQKALEADIRCRQYLMKATDAKERGDLKKAEKYEEKASYWLSRMNRWEGNY